MDIKHTITMLMAVEENPVAVLQALVDVFREYAAHTQRGPRMEDAFEDAGPHLEMAIYEFTRRGIR